MHSDLFKTFAEMNVPRETFLKLQAYVDLIIKWNKSINLVSPHDIENIWHKHILLSAELINHIKNKNIHIVDLGSGSGFPGIVLSILGVKKMTLIEANSKKASFLLQASRISDHQVNIINDRIEAQKLDCDIITSRALAKIDKIISLSTNINFSDKILLLKGPKAQEEIDSVKNLNFQIIESRYNANSTIVAIHKS